MVAADWMNVEGRLTAHFSGDRLLQRRLDEELRGGPKVHALHAELIYGDAGAIPKGVTAENAKKVLVEFKGGLFPAYDAGKRLTHAWNYGMRESEMAEQFWITKSEARRIGAVLSGEYVDVVAWRREIANLVYGIAIYACRCGHAQRIIPGDCPRCRTPLRFDGWENKPERVLYTPFGARRWYLGRRSEGINALASQLPQGCGSSMWDYTLMRLHGFEVVKGGEIRPWPVPEGVLTWHPGLPYRRLLQRAMTRVVTGTYDSYLLRSMEQRAKLVAAWVVWTMEQPWEDLGGKRFPSEPSMGMNWGKKSDRCWFCEHGEHEGKKCEVCACEKYVPTNVDGLEEMKEGKPLTAWVEVRDHVVVAGGFGERATRGAGTFRSFVPKVSQGVGG